VATGRGSKTSTAAFTGLTTLPTATHSPRRRLAGSSSCEPATMASVCCHEPQYLTAAGRREQDQGHLHECRLTEIRGRIDQIHFQGNGPNIELFAELGNKTQAWLPQRTPSAGALIDLDNAPMPTCTAVASIEAAPYNHWWGLRHQPWCSSFRSLDHYSRCFLCYGMPLSDL